jgi:hypothetical protein
MAMSRRYKFVVVFAGYAAALLVACGACYLVTLARNHMSQDASGGMQAFGDLLLFIGLFGVLALVPTTLALYFLRASGKFWTVFSIASLALAATGPVAAIMLATPQKFPSLGLIVGLFGLLKVLGAPLFGLGFLICAVVAPIRSSRRVLLAAAGIEFTVSAYAFFCLFVAGHWVL